MFQFTEYLFLAGMCRQKGQNMKKKKTVPFVKTFIREMVTMYTLRAAVFV